MVITTIGQSGTMLRIGSDVATPAFVDIGSGSGAIVVGNEQLFAGAKQGPFSTSDLGTARFWEFSVDFSAPAMSGIVLTEFGVSAVSGLGAGSIWQHEGFAAVTFDGTNELQIEIKWEVF